MLPLMLWNKLIHIEIKLKTIPNEITYSNLYYTKMEMQFNLY